jgi:hypothetical protein
LGPPCSRLPLPCHPTTPSLSDSTSDFISRMGELDSNLLQSGWCIRFHFISLLLSPWWCDCEMCHSKCGLCWYSESCPPASLLLATFRKWMVRPFSLSEFSAPPQINLVLISWRLSA